MKYYLPILLVFCAVFTAKATHIKGGLIEYRQVSGRTFEFKVIGYRDISGILFQNGTFDFGDGNVFGGEDGDVIPWVRESPQNGVEKWQFVVSYTYTNPGNYTVSYTEENRNENVQNINGSINTAFHIESLLTIDPLFGQNSSPNFRLPDFSGIIGQTYLTSFSVEDPDGDSLSYRFTTPLQGRGEEVAGYQGLDAPSLYEGNPGKLDLSATTGNLIWQINSLAGIPVSESRDYTVTVKVTQWRSNVIIGENTIDYQVEVWNLSPDAFTPIDVTFPESRCLDENDTEIMDEIVISNPSQLELNVSFEGNDDSFLVNNLPVESWNNQVADSLINSENLVIQVRNDRENSNMEVGFSSLRMNVEVSISGEQFNLDLTQSQALLYGEDCDFEALSVREIMDPIVTFSSESIILSPESTFKKAIITDLSGQLILEFEVTRTRTIKHNCEKNTVYLLTLVSDQEISTTKFLIK